jgi:hypothetical protein
MGPIVWLTMASKSECKAGSKVNQWLLREAIEWASNAVQFACNGRLNDWSQLPRCLPKVIEWKSLDISLLLLHYINTKWFLCLALGGADWLLLLIWITMMGWLFWEDGDTFDYRSGYSYDFLFSCPGMTDLPRPMIAKNNQMLVIQCFKT